MITLLGRLLLLLNGFLCGWSAAGDLWYAALLCGTTSLLLLLYWPVDQELTFITHHRRPRHGSLR